MAKVRDDVLEALLVYAFRYALGRMTYSVYDVTSAIIEHKQVLAQSTRDLIMGEIAQAVIRDEAGMDCDMALWLEVTEVLSHE